MRLFACLFLLAFAAAGCAGPEGELPSLGPRPIEGILDEPVYAIAPVPSLDDPALAARIDALRAEAQQGEQAFAAYYPTAARAVAAAQGSAPESEPWIEAHLAISALDSSRSPTGEALASLDAILAEQALAGQTAEIDALAAARDDVAALFASQAERYGRLNSNLSTR